MKGKEKYLIISLLLVLFILIIVALFIKPANKINTELSNDPDVVISNAEKESTSIKDSEKKKFIEINTNEFLEILKGTTKKVVLIARPTCEYCQIATPIIQHVAYNYNIDINYLNTDDFSDEDDNNFINSNDFFKEDFGTPTLIIVKDNNIIDSIGLTDYAHYLDFFKRNNIIKE